MIFVMFQKRILSTIRNEGTQTVVWRVALHPRSDGIADGHSKISNSDATAVLVVGYNIYIKLTISLKDGVLMALY